MSMNTSQYIWDSTNSEWVKTRGTANGDISVSSSPNFVGTAADCQTQADLLDTTDVGVYTFFATDTNQYGTLSAYAASTGTITWETLDGYAKVTSITESPDGTVSRGADDSIATTATAAFTAKTALAVSVRLVADGGAVADGATVYIVFNTTDAATDLASDVIRDRIVLNEGWETYTFPSSNPAVSMYYKANGVAMTNAVLEWKIKE